MAGLLATKWIAAKNAAVKEDFRLVLWNQNFEGVLDKLEAKIEDASENPKPTDQDIAEMKKLFTAYQAAGKDYIQKIVAANKTNPNGGKSWFVLHEGIYKIDLLLTDMLRNDSHMKGPWPKLTGFVAKTDFKMTVEQPAPNPQLAAESLDEYNTQGFFSLAEKVKSAVTSADKAKALLTGLNTCLPHNRKLVDSLKGHANIMSQLVSLFENQIKPAALNAQTLQSAKTTLDKIKAEGKTFLSALPPQATPFVKVLTGLLQGLEQELASAKPNRPATPAPSSKPK